MNRIFGCLFLLTSACTVATRGEPGANGATGAAGPAGEAGPPGLQGPIGPQGAIGLQGDAGQAIDPRLFIQNQTAVEQPASFKIGGSAIAAGGFFFAGGSGDANANGAVAGTDRSIIVNYLSGSSDGGVGLLATPEQMRNADVDGDGRITTLDRDAVTEIILGKPLIEVQREARRTVDLIANTAISGGNGDGNENGVTNSGDAQRIYFYLSGGTDLTPRERARLDYNGDGRVDALDAQAIFGSATVTSSAARRASDSAFSATLSGHLRLGKTATTAPNALDCNAESDGAITIDTTNFRLYVCSGGAWRFTQLQ